MKWKYKNTFLLLVSLIVLYFVAETEFVKQFIAKIGEWGYFGAFLVGIFFVSTFTVAPSVLVIYYLAQSLNPWEVAIFAGIGAVIGDALIFSFLRDGIFDEIRPLFSFFQKPLFLRMINSSYFAWFLPIIGALIIASPFPDEIGISLMGLSKIKRWQFLIVSFVLNSAGLLIITTLARG
ncbi:MAG: hypothetical protein UT48_C0007G0028 [Parcubacteria group bacterium GW2011_GWE2_39_37]|uniref:TVP38/TMEM64 family membrane protein n=1 Tax=Candidatus Falkowbacteria bacterium GW2011_GWF2_39_8 TaxID=1618642 RepID=A0A0G0Q8J9_9BACT|nr:MAG: hypothetical protein UT48_C0007G0028 [Parcubacteria group bacterium GW2011_GWE2_39_37]KKR33631.1 MAG: hypothetical protein UT64_C0005G0011 [Candidatus Falkowbacteria bacterium GW2011_GWF2_39_8]